MVEADRAEQKLAELMGRLGEYFTRVEPVRQAGKYVRGLMSDLPRKNCWTLAEYAGDRTPDRMHRLLERASWNTLEVMDTVRDFGFWRRSCGADVATGRDGDHALSRILLRSNEKLARPYTD